MHLPNGSKIFIEASNEREYDLSGLTQMMLASQTLMFSC